MITAETIIKRAIVETKDETKINSKEEKNRAKKSDRKRT